MKRILSLSLMVLMLLSTVLGLAACGETTDSGAVINAYYVGELYDFDPARADVDDDAMRVLALLYEPLFRLNENGKVKPALADDYVIIRNEEEGDYKMEITLKPTTWSDGSTVTAYDVVFAWKRILDPDFRSQAAPLLYEVKNAVEAKNSMRDEKGHLITTEDFGAVAVNANTISITFRNPVDAEGKPILDEDGKPVEPNYDAFLYNLTSVALSPLRQSVVESAPDYWGKRSITIVTNGPFTVSELDHNLAKFTLERNRYYDYANRDAVEDDPADEKVTPYRIVQDWSILSEQVADKFAEESIFIMSELPLALRNGDGALEDIEVVDALSTKTILLNTNGYDDSDDRGTALSDPAIRKALSDVISRKAIAEKLVFAKPAGGFISHGVFDAGERGTFFREEGDALLSENAVATTVDLSKLSDVEKKLTLAHADTEADTAVAELVKTAWESLGFTVTLVPLSYTVEERREIIGKQEFTYTFRDSHLIDAAEDFAIKTSDTYYKDANGKAADYLEIYSARKRFGSEAERARLSNFYFDAVLVDYQMHAPDAFGVLAGFSSTLNGNGMDLSVDGETAEQTMERYLHVTGFKNAEYDALIEKAYNERDLEARAARLHEAEELLLANAPIIPLTFGQNHYVFGDKISKVEMDYYGYAHFTKTRLKNYEDYLPVEEEPEGEETTAVTTAG